MKIIIENGLIHMNDDDGNSISGKGITGIDIFIRPCEKPKAILYCCDNINADVFINQKDIDFVVR